MLSRVHRTSLVLASVLVAAVGMASCGGDDQAGRVSAGQRPASTDRAVVSAEARAIPRFADAIAHSPYYASASDVMPGSLEAALGGARGVIVGDVIGLTPGPIEVRPATATFEDGPRTVEFKLVTLGVRISVTDAAGSDVGVATGDEMTVVVPVWLGVDEVIDQATTTFLSPLMDDLPLGSRLLVAVGSMDGDIVTPAGVGSVVVGSSDGTAASLLPGSLSEASAWGATDVRVLGERAVSFFR